MPETPLNPFATSASFLSVLRVQALLPAKIFPRQHDPPDRAKMLFVVPCRFSALEGPSLSLTLKPRHSVRAKISAVGAYVPPRLLTNADLEKLVATNDQWITERTGIRERHIVEKGVGTSDLAVEAARKCLAARGIDASELEV